MRVIRVPLNAANPDGPYRELVGVEGNLVTDSDGTQTFTLTQTHTAPDGTVTPSRTTLTLIPRGRIESGREIASTGTIPADPGTLDVIAIPRAVERGTAVGADATVQSDDGTALGAGARVAGVGSVAIGRNAQVGTVGVIGSPEVLGVYNVIRDPYTVGTATVSGRVTGTGAGAYIVLSEDHPTLGAAGTRVELTASAEEIVASTTTVPGTFTIAYEAVAETTTTDNGLTGRLEGNVLTLTAPGTVGGVSLPVGAVVNLGTDTVVITSYSPEVTAFNDVVTANNAVAIGKNASVTGDNGIAIGADVTAAADQIRIGNENQTDVRIGAYHLSAISTNTADIQTNRAGIASAVAIANLPAVQGPKGGWSLALGSFDGETAIAGGINFDVLSSSIVKISVASSDGETSAGIGFGMGF